MTDSTRKSGTANRLAPLFAVLTFLACNATLILIAALSAIGISISINPHLQAAAIALFAVVTLLLVFRDFKKHQALGPLILAAVASATLVGSMYIHFNKVVESIGLLALFSATLWSWQLSRRDRAQNQT
jgi:membrane associated rhomboid family serine protease